MKQYLAFIKKEFYHVLRDYRTMLVLIGIPVVQIVLFGFALSTEVKNTRVAVMDLSKDQMTMELIEEIHASKYFDVVEAVKNIEDAENSLRSGKAKMVIVMPSDFAADLSHSNGV